VVVLIISALAGIDGDVPVDGTGYVSIMEVLTLVKAYRMVVKGLERD
jgi:hypothetical protein